MVSVARGDAFCDKTVLFNPLPFIFKARGASFMYAFIFSNNLVPRVGRHFAFWLLYLFGVAMLYVPLEDGRIFNPHLPMNAITDGFAFLPVYAFCVYSTIYYILPRYLLRKSIPFLAGSATVVFSINFAAGFFIAKMWLARFGVPISFLDAISFTAHRCMANTFTITIAAVIIKIMKDYFFRRRDHEKLLVEHLANRLRLLKMRLHPQLLFVSLRRISVEIKNESSLAPEMILRLSDLISYLLYESQTDLVSLDQEERMIRQYIALKQLEFNRSIPIIVEGPLAGRRIAPGLLLQRLEAFIEREGYVTGLELIAGEGAVRLRLHHGGATETWEFDYKL
jgi:two-component system, LytTR family, sensor kinase